MLSNPKDKEILKKAIQEISDSMVRMEAEKDLIREIVAKQSKDLKLSKKVISKMAKVYHKRNYDEEVANHEEFDELYTSVIK